VGVVVIDRPPLNLLAAPLRQSLLALLRQVMEEPRLQAAVLACAGPTFIAGAELHEFDAPPEEPTDATLAAFIEAAGKPFVAALHGSALGAGFELALACHARVMAPDAWVGLPQSRIGLLPGAGGTQRLPRLIGATMALELLVSGRRVAADEALRLGLVEEIATDPRRAAIERARRMASLPVLPRASERTVDDVRSAKARAAFAAAAAAVASQARGAIAPVRAAEAVGWAVELPFASGLQREYAAWLALRAAPQSRALRHLFHAERAAARLPLRGEPDVQPWPLHRCGVVGTGTISSALATALAAAGLSVTLVETSPAAAAGARPSLDISAEADDESVWQRPHVARDLRALADASLVIVAAPEEMAGRRAIFRRLSAIVRRDCLLASTRSAPDLELLADVVDAPERVLGLYLRHPALGARLVEVERLGRTAPESIATGLLLARRLGMAAVTVSYGSCADRLFVRLRAQCDLLLLAGASPAQVDAALEAAGYTLGPYATADLIGLDAAPLARELPSTRTSKQPPAVPIADWLLGLGRLGQQAGAGYYRYAGGCRQPDPLLTVLAERAAALRGIQRRPVATEEIVVRVQTALVNEAARMLSEGMVRRPLELDVVTVAGLGYPAWRGGVLFDADAVGIDLLAERAVAMEKRDGEGWEAAPLLREMAAVGKRFTDLNR
jgi:3-hydroxyacyl-CoA dehydrogenase